MINAEQFKRKIRNSGFRPKRSLGQIFLIDKWVSEIILAVAELQPDDHVIEIGAGFGRLTSRLAETGASTGKEPPRFTNDQDNRSTTGKEPPRSTNDRDNRSTTGKAARFTQVTVIELDDFLYAELQAACAGYSNVNLVHGDILELELSSFLNSAYAHNKIVANLPYYITSPILKKLLKFSSSLALCVLMVQKEVAERIVASPGTKDYGIPTVSIDYYAEAEIIASVTADSFYPPPKVDSAIVKLTMRDSPHYFKPNMNFHKGFDTWQWIRGQEFDAWQSGPKDGVAKKQHPEEITEYWTIRTPPVQIWGMKPCNLI